MLPGPNQHPSGCLAQNVLTSVRHMHPRHMGFPAAYCSLCAPLLPLPQGQHVGQKGKRRRRIERLGWALLIQIFLQSVEGAVSLCFPPASCWAGSQSNPVPAGAVLRPPCMVHAPQSSRAAPMVLAPRGRPYLHG